MTERRSAALRAALGGAAVFLVFGAVLIGVLAALLVPDFLTLRAEDEVLSYEVRADVAVLTAGMLAALPAGAAASLLAAHEGLHSRALLALAAPLLIGGLYLLTSDVSNLGRLMGLALLPLSALAGHVLAARWTEPSTNAQRPRSTA